MGKRIIEFKKGNYYHVFNRGVDKRNIFEDQEDVFYFFHRLMDLNSEINFGHNKKRNLSSNIKKMENKEKLVSIVSYCLLPNHFHLVLKELTETGISRFMQKLGTSYTKFFNKKYERSGSLFQGKFKAKEINGYLSVATLSVYVNLNYKHHGLDLKNRLVKSSILEYLDKEKFEKICPSRSVIDELGGLNKYKNFLIKVESNSVERRAEKPGKEYLMQKLKFEELEY